MKILKQSEENPHFGAHHQEEFFPQSSTEGRPMKKPTNCAYTDKAAVQNLTVNN